MPGRPERCTGWDGVDGRGRERGEASAAAAAVPRRRGGEGVSGRARGREGRRRLFHDVPDSVAPSARLGWDGVDGRGRERGEASAAAAVVPRRRGGEGVSGRARGREGRRRALL